MYGDYFTKPQQGSKCGNSRVNILNLKQDPTLVSQECVETSSPNKPASANLCGCSHVPMTDTSQEDILVRRKATSYLMAAKGLQKKANNNMNKVNSLYSINLK